MRIAIYTRISTSDGRQTTENQLNPLREWATRIGGVVIKEYADEASGTKADRKALTQMLEDAHKKEFDILLVWALDRLSREGIAKMTAYLEKLKSYGVRVQSHQESWLDTSGPVSDLLIAIFGWVAQQERSRIQERVKAGLTRAKIAGKKLGRPRAKVNIEKAIALKLSGNTVRMIAQILGVPRSTISDYLSGKGIAQTG